MASSKVLELCEALDQIDEIGQEFTTSELKALGVSTSSVYLLPLLAEKGYVERTSRDRVKPAKFKRLVNGDGKLKSLTEACNNGEFDGIFGELAKKKGGISGTTRRQRTTTESAEPTPPQEQTFEINLYDIAEQMSEDEFGTMVAGFIRLKNAQLRPLQEKIMYLEDQARIRTVENNNAVQLLESKVNSLNQELLRERESVINLRNQLMNAEESRVREETPVRVIAVGGHGVNQKDSGGSGGRPGGVMVHGRPYIGNHPNRAVTEHNKPVIEHRKK